MFWFVCAFVSLVLLIFYKKSNGSMGKLRFFDGEITEINLASNEVKVRYTVDGNIVEAVSKEKNVNFSKLKLGTKVLICTYKDLPEIPLNFAYNRKGRLYNFTIAQKYALIFTVGFLLWEL